MKDRFKTHFGTSFDTFMDEEETASSADDKAKTKAGETDETPSEQQDPEIMKAEQSVETEVAKEESRTDEQFYTHDKDEMLLHRLQWANS